MWFGRYSLTVQTSRTSFHVVSPCVCALRRSCLELLVMSCQSSVLVFVSKVCIPHGQCWFFCGHSCWCSFDLLCPGFEVDTHRLLQESVLARQCQRFHVPWAIENPEKSLCWTTSHAIIWACNGRDDTLCCAESSLRRVLSVASRLPCYPDAETCQGVIRHNS